MVPWEAPIVPKEKTLEAVERVLREQWECIFGKPGNGNKGKIYNGGGESSVNAVSVIVVSINWYQSHT